MDRATAEGEDRYSGSPLGTQQGGVDLVLPAGGGAAAGVSRGSGGSSGGDGSTRVGGDLGAPATFLYKLCDILDEPHLSEHIAWNKEGDGIVVKQPAQFAKTVLPQYYKHNNFQSFLNIYGFRKARHDKDSWEFKQPHFKRGQRHLLGLIRRKGGGGSANSGHSNSDNHNFSSSNSDTIEPPRKRHRDGSDKVGVEETQDLVGRVTSELRAVCSRVVHLEAVMGMINHKHNHLRLESQALLRVVLSEGGQRLGERAVAAVQQLPHTSGEPEMSELLSFLLHPSQGQREQNDQRQSVQEEQQQQRRHQHGRQEGAPETPEPPPPQPRNPSTGASSDTSGDRHDYHGNDASGLTPLSSRRGSRPPADDEVRAPARVDPGGVFHPDHFLLGELAQAAVAAAAERAGGGPGGTSPFAGDAGGADSGVENTAGAGGGLRNAEAGAAPRDNAERESAASFLLSDATAAAAAAAAAAASPPAANDGGSSVSGQNQPSSDGEIVAVSGREVGSTDSPTAGMHVATLQGPGPGLGTAAGVAPTDVPLPHLLQATDSTAKGRSCEGAALVSVASGVASRVQTESRKRPLGRGTEHAHGRESLGGGEGQRGADSGAVASSKRRIGRRR